MGQALSNIHGVLLDGQSMAEQGAPLPLTWQSANDHPHRVSMIYRLLGIIHSRIGSYQQNQQEAADYLPDIARHMELALYRRAASLEEYLDLSTLNKRLQFLALTAYPPCANDFGQLSLEASKVSAAPNAAASQQSSSPLSGDKPKRKMTEELGLPMQSWPQGPSRLLKKRRTDIALVTLKVGNFFGQAGAEPFLASPIADSSSSTPKCLTPRHSFRPSSTFLLGNNQDLIMSVYAFLDGKEAIRHSAVNKFAARFLPQCVQSLQVHPKQLSDIFDYSSAIGGQLSLYPQLGHISIFVEPKETEDVTPPSYWPVSQGAVKRITRAGISGECSSSLPQLGFLASNYERVIRNFIAALSAGSCPNLESICLCAVFFNGQRNSVVSLLTAALKKGVCPKLKSLQLIGNGIGDAGALDLVDMIQSGCCPDLRRLDLRRNYIGEVGVGALAAAIEGKKLLRLENLNLGGNLLGCGAVQKLSSALAAGGCPKLETLCLDSNFIQRKGAKYLAKAITSVHFPPLRYLNLRENAAAECFALYFSKLLLMGRLGWIQCLILGSVTNRSASYVTKTLRHMKRSLTVEMHTPVMITATE